MGDKKTKQEGATKQKGSIGGLAGRGRATSPTPQTPVFRATLYLLPTLPDNSIGVEGARAFAEALKVNRTLTHLSVESMLSSF